MSVVGVIARLSTAAADGAPGGYPVTRTTNAGYDGATGDALAGTVTTLNIDAVIEPVVGKHFDAQVEGRHTEAVIGIITATALLTPSAANQADRVTYLGEVYEVLRVDGPIRLRGGTHFEVFAARLVAP